MNLETIPWTMALAVFIGTAPLLGVITFNLIKVDRLEAKIDRLETRIDGLQAKIAELASKVAELAERVSKIEGKIEGRHVLVE